MVSCIRPPSTAWSLSATGFCLAFWRGCCAPWIPPWVFFLVRSAESWNCLKPWICLEYPSFLALESWNCWRVAAWSQLPWIALPLLSYRTSCLPFWRRGSMSLILVPRLRPCSGRLKGKAMICLLTVSVRIKARAETDSGRFTKRYFYTVLSRVYNFYKL